jgi:hypothetical protein
MTNQCNQLLRLGAAAERLYGQNTTATRQRLIRLADSGQLRAIRIGARGDRWFASADIDRLLGGGSSDRCSTLD